MSVIYDSVSCRFFESGVSDLAELERCLNFILDYDEGANTWKHHSITYNDLMHELFSAPPLMVGKNLTYILPIEIELFKRILGVGKTEIYIMHIHDSKNEL